MTSGRGYSGHRQLAALHLTCAVLAALGAISGRAPRGWADATAAFGVAVAALLVRPRFVSATSHPFWSLVLAVETLVLIGISGAVGVVPPRSFGLLFVPVFACVGMHHPPRVSLRLLPVAALVYVVSVEMTIGDAPPLDFRGVLLTVVVCAVVGESVASFVTRAARTTAAFRAVSAVTSDLSASTEDPLARVVDAVLELGYDGASLAVLDPATETFTVDYAVGHTAELVGTFPAGKGIGARVVATGAAEVVEDYRNHPDALESVRDTGIRTVVVVPVRVGGVAVGVLSAGFTRKRVISESRLTALELLAHAAGTALSAAVELEGERARAVVLADMASTDALTGVDNRRAAGPLLDGLAVGDSVVLIDLDHFKKVNDTHGHQAGDHLLIEIAHHLRDQLRDGDSVIRYGGEEFLVILPGTPEHRAVVIVERLRQTWNARCPITTFSAGVAGHRGEAHVTVAVADKALYAAKDTGRDRVVTAAGGDMFGPRTAAAASS